MTNPKRLPSTGYRLERVYASELSYTLRSGDPLPPEVDFPVNIAWDWRPIGSRQFDVVLALTVGGESTPFLAEATLVGTFTFSGDGDPMPSLPNFLRLNAPAILFPYLREAISSLTRYGPQGPRYIPPTNVVAVTAGFDLSLTTGARVLQSDPELAKDFGMSLALEATTAA